MSEINIGTAQKNGELSEADKLKGWHKPTVKVTTSPLPSQVISSEKVIKVDKIDEMGEVMPGSIKEMDFPSAIRITMNGKKITRTEWGNKNIYCFLNGDILSIHMLDGNNHKWIINEGDMIAEDWVVLDK